MKKEKRDRNRKPVWIYKHKYTRDETMDILTNQITHVAKILAAYKQNVLIRAPYPMDGIKALIFHPTIHQNFEAIPVLVCKCVIILGLRFTRIKLNPTLN